MYFVTLTHILLLVVSLPALLLQLVWWPLAVYVIYYFAQWAFNIRTYAIRDYGRVIHEFDPWFNFRATRYLEAEGLYKLLHW